MKLKKVILSFTVVLLLLNYFPALGQHSGYYVIPPELQGIITEPFMDSLRAKLASQTKTFLHIDYDSLGNLMWNGGTGLKWFPNEPNKLKGTIFSCTENGWIKSEVQFDTSTNTKDYEIHTPCYDVLGDQFWTETIDVDVLDSTEIVINSPVDITAKIYKAYDFGPSINQFLITGNGIGQIFSVNLESDASYIVVFINYEEEIVSIKRIGA